MKHLAGHWLLSDLLRFVLCGSLAAAICPVRQSLYAQVFVNRTTAAGLSTIGLTGGTNSVTVCDYDGDGDLDLYLVVQASFQAGDRRTWNRLLSNNGDGTFTDVTAQAGIAGRDSSTAFSYMGQKMGASWGDYDNDGHPDLFLTHFGPDQLFHNNGDGTFSEVTALAGVAGGPTQLSASALWFDYDVDGDLDLYVCVREDYTSGVRDRRNRLYRNIGHGRFTDVSAGSGVADSGLTYTALAIDANNDDLPDLFLANDFGVTQLYVNNGNGTFTNGTDDAGLRYGAEGMGLAIADVDGNGYFDIYLTNVTENGGTMRNPLFLNAGDGHYLNRAVEAGVSQAGWSWGADFLDYDNDGREDLFVGNGYFSQVFANRLFHNIADSTGVRFQDVSFPAGVADSADTRGIAVADWNNDGHPDLLVSSFSNEPARIVQPLLYENTMTGGNWLEIVPEGTTCNRDAFGAVFRIEAGGVTRWKYNHGAQFLGQNIAPVHVGLGTAAAVDRIVVRWPGGMEEDAGSAGVNQTIRIRQGSGQVPLRNAPVPAGLTILGNYPNPFNGGTTIRFLLGEPGEVRLRVVDILGRRVEDRTMYFSGTGEHAMTWGPVTNASGSTGTYLYRLEGPGGAAVTGKMLLMR